MAPNEVFSKRKASGSKSTSSARDTLATRPSTRKRKLNPDLKDRVETFLSNANPDTNVSAKSGPAKRRKISSQRPIQPLPPSALPSSGAKDLKTAKPAINASKVDAKAKKAPKKEPIEKRLRVYRKAPPQTYLQKLERATTQRMIVLNRKRVDEEAFPCEVIELAGSTGNVYVITVGLEPRCTCPDYLKGNQCKHIVYCLVNVLKAPVHLQYQLAFLSSELREIFAHAPAIPTEIESAHDTSGNRKPIEGECPICYMDFDEDHNELVWCKASCGNNMHKSCFDQWVASQRGSVVRCVYCRATWSSYDGGLSKVAQQGVPSEAGYVNVAHLTGQSTMRDVSSYHQHWVRRHYLGLGY